MAGAMLLYLTNSRVSVYQTGTEGWRASDAVPTGSGSYEYVFDFEITATGGL